MSLKVEYKIEIEVFGQHVYWSIDKYVDGRWMGEVENGTAFNRIEAATTAERALARIKEKV